METAGGSTFKVHAGTGGESLNKLVKDSWNLPVDSGRARGRSRAHISTSGVPWRRMLTVDVRHSERPVAVKEELRIRVDALMFVTVCQTAHSKRPLRAPAESPHEALDVPSFGCRAS